MNLFSMDTSSRQQFSDGHPFISDDIPRAIEVQVLHLSDYDDEKVYAKVQ